MLALSGKPLERWHEPLVVGAAVVLFGLVYLVPQDRQVASNENSVARDNVIVEEALFAKRTRDPAFYREQWARETARFYAANPPRSETPPIRESTGKPSPVQVARLDGGSAENVQPTAGGIAPASHSELAQPSAVASAMPPVPALPAESSHEQNVGRRWHVLTCLATGLLASLAYVVIWPTASIPAGPSIGTLPDDTLAGQAVAATTTGDERQQADSIQIHLPSQWVHLRPTMGQTVRRGVLGGSYLLALIGAWGLFAQT